MLLLFFEKMNESKLVNDSCYLTHLSYSRTIKYMSSILKEKKCQQITAQIVENLASPTYFPSFYYPFTRIVVESGRHNTDQNGWHKFGKLPPCNFIFFLCQPKTTLIWQLFTEFSFTTENLSLLFWIDNESVITNLIK